ncbi:MAG: OmpA family protein [Bacteroidales bacterium]|nr:OmpA family protein [Bacteroidales bacterium]
MKFSKIFPKKLLVMALLAAIAFSASAQNVEFTRSAFPNDPDGLREASRNLRTGENLFYQGGGRTLESIDYLLKAHAFNPNNGRLNYLIGQALLQTIDYPQAVEYLEKARTLGYPDPEVYFFLAEAYHVNKDFHKAIELYATFRQQLLPQELALRRQIIEKRVAQCQHGISLVASPARVYIDNLGSGINSSYDDYSPKLLPGDEQMFFTSRRPLESKARIDRIDYKYFENILIAEKTGDQWRATGHAGNTLNRRNHSAVAAISHDGLTMIVYNGSKGGDLFISEFTKGKWSKPSRLRNGINSRHQETSAALSADGNTLYFISDRPGGYGGKDIWFTYKDRRGRWLEPMNLGPVVNTEYDEEGLYLTPDGETLYFSSKGHNSMGGYDIFSSTWANGRWNEPVNLGYPINSPANDLFFRPTSDGETAYFSSLRAGGQGGSDLYKVTFMGPEKPVINQMQNEPIASRARPNMGIFLDQTTPPIPPMTLLRGRVLNDETGEPLLANLELYDNEQEELLATFATNPETGAYFISLPGGKNFGISVQAEDFLFHSENINITETDVFTEIINDIRLKRVEVGTTIVLRNIFFDTGSASLRPESYAELGVLYKLLEDNPKIKIEISGHTDNVGSAALNQRLSQDRARAVVDFLTERGTAPDRLTYKGYGFSRPVATNDTPEGRQLNRRTEFEIIEK